MLPVKSHIIAYHLKAHAAFPHNGDVSAAASSPTMSYLLVLSLLVADTLTEVPALCV